MKKNLFIIILTILISLHTSASEEIYHNSESEILPQGIVKLKILIFDAKKKRVFTKYTTGFHLYPDNNRIYFADTFALDQLRSISIYSNEKKIEIESAEIKKVSKFYYVDLKNKLKKPGLELYCGSEFSYDSKIKTWTFRVSHADDTYFNIGLIKRYGIPRTLGGIRYSSFQMLFQFTVTAPIGTPLVRVSDNKIVGFIMGFDAKENAYSYGTSELCEFNSLQK